MSKPLATGAEHQIEIFYFSNCGIKAKLHWGKHEKVRGKYKGRVESPIVACVSSSIQWMAYICAKFINCQSQIGYIYNGLTSRESHYRLCNTGRKDYL